MGIIAQAIAHFLLCFLEIRLNCLTTNQDAKRRTDIAKPTIIKYPYQPSEKRLFARGFISTTPLIKFRIRTVDKKSPSHIPKSIKKTPLIFI